LLLLEKFGHSEIQKFIILSVVDLRLVLLCVLRHLPELELLCGCSLAPPLRLGFILVLPPSQKVKSVLEEPEQNLPLV
jgi:hypothetical protein